jgi:hypothetical protein
MTTTRLDRVMQNQRRLMFVNVAAMVTLVASLGASLASLL